MKTNEDVGKRALELLHQKRMIERDKKKAVNALMSINTTTKAEIGNILKKHQEAEYNNLIEWNEFMIQARELSKAVYSEKKTGPKTKDEVE